MVKNRKGVKIIAFFMAVILALNADVVTSASLTNKQEDTLATVRGAFSTTDDVKLEGIQVRLYDAKEASSNDKVPQYEGLSNADGTYEIKDVEKGNYRIEFALDEMLLNEDVAPEDKIDIAKYAIRLANEEAEDILHQVEGEDYFAYINDFKIEAESILDLVFDVPDEEETKVPSDATAPTNLPKVQGEEESKVEAKVEQEDLLTIEELKNVDPLVAMATMGKDEVVAPLPILQRLARAVSGTDWSFDVYYVNENDKYYVEKNRDFNLKYQVEFHNSIDLDAGAVEIRIPRTLFTDRDGNAINPVDIAVPKVDDSSQSIEVANSPFNYYIDGDDLVFFNYKDIPSGSNAAFQVLYKSLSIMKIVDQTKWWLTPTISVLVNNALEEATTTPLRGLVDSRVLLSSVTKVAFNDPRRAFTPGLYTRAQVAQSIQGALPQEYDNNFDNYRFVIWEVTVIGEATQPWNLYLKDTPKFGSSNGTLVGYRKLSPAVAGYTGSITDPYPNIITGGGYNQYTKLKENSEEEIIRYKIAVVTAYPKSQVSEGKVVENTIDVILQPVDGYDANQQKSSRATWSWVNYRWRYYGDILWRNKEIRGSHNGGNDRNFEGWLDVYQASKAAGKDSSVISLPFVSYGAMYGYSYTHNLTGDNAGKPIPGKTNKLITVDDFVYAFPNSNSSTYRILDYRDYYFSSVRIVQEDNDYDIFEDTLMPPVPAGNVKVYAYLAKSPLSTDWELMATIPWDPSGKMTYEFTAAQLAREPWRIKVEHETSNYVTVCTIDSALQIRHNSPVFAQMLIDFPNMQEVTIENIEGSYGELITNGTVTQIIQEDWTYPQNYSEPELLAKTKELYNNIVITRENAFARALKYSTTARAYKSGTATNDRENGRVNVNYVLRAHDGYRIFSEEAAKYLKDGGVSSPGRNNVVFYDLLPHGVRFDPSKPIIAGRVGTTAVDNPNSWDTTQMKVKVDASDVIDNYRGTGRMMVVFHVSYEGVDSAIYQGGQWQEHFGLSFGAYYDWKDIGVVKESANIAAFMPAIGDDRPLSGTTSEVALDNGVIVPADIHNDYKDFGADINGDGKTNIRNVLYANAIVDDDVAIASQSGINKLVKADADIFGLYTKSAVVDKTKGYSYDIAVTNANSAPLEDIVIYDRLENSGVDRQVEEPGIFEANWWQGTFVGINTSYLELQGIAPVIYYNANRDARIAESGTDNPAVVLTTINGWIKASDWNQPLSEVRAVAVDISRKTNNTKFQLESSKSVSFRIQMKAPDEVPDEATYAYNNPSFYSYDTGLHTNKTVVGNSVRVRLADATILEVVKKFDGEVPNMYTNWQFQFTAYQMDGDVKTPYRNREYKLYKINEEGNWERQEGIYATDSRGRFYLRNNEKAVFAGAGVAELVIEEEANRFWKQTIVTNNVGDTKTVTFNNKYQPVLYAQKVLNSVPIDKKAERADDEFTFQILVDGEPFANADFWYVEKALTNGGIPAKLGEGVADEQGMFTIKSGEIVAFNPGDQGVQCTIREVAWGENWVVEKPEISGKLSINGQHVVINNFYKWKDLYLTKLITHQEVQDVAPGTEFTFRVLDAAKNPLTTENVYVVLKNGSEVARGILNPDGTFTAECAGAVVKIEKLVANQTYFVEEIDDGILYEVVGTGIVEVKMPLYATSEKTEITNDYLKRPISVSKIVSYNREDANAALIETDLKTYLFSMRLLINGAPKLSYPYDVYKNGVWIARRNTNPLGYLFIKDGETAVFKDVCFKGDDYEVLEAANAKYQQLFPVDNGTFTGNVVEGVEVTFINGTEQGQLLLSKEYVPTDEVGEEYIEQMKNNSAVRKAAAVSASLEVDTGSGTYTWPQTRTQVTVIDNWQGGTKQLAWWEAGSSFALEPGKVVILPPIVGESYTLRESMGDQYRIYEYDKDQWLEVKAKGHPVTGTFLGNPIAVLYNELTGIDFNGSEIGKRMTFGSEEVAIGSKLVWRLEQYDGNVWNPAAGVTYVTFDSVGVTTDRILTTESDGRIILKKTENDFPRVRFIDINVYLNRYTGMTAGDYRVVELLDESDLDWGSLAGYGKGIDDVDLALVNGAKVFVNANNYTLVDIEKKMETLSDEVFAMILKRVTSTTTTPIGSKEDILASEIAANIAYTIYDSASGKEVGSGVTTARGEIFLKGGQYASLQLPYNTLWTVSEEAKRPYFLKELTGSPNNQVTKLDDNLMLIHVIDDWENLIITKAMVDANAIIDARTGEAVNFRSGIIDIPEKVIYNGMKYRVTGIGDAAVANPNANNLDVTGIRLPNSLITIGADAFANYRGMRGDLIIPDKVTTIGERAFYETGVDGAIIIGDSVTDIGLHAFRSAPNVTSLKLGNSVKTIGRQAFYECRNLSGDLIIPDSVEYIDVGAFTRAYTTGATIGNLILGNSVKEIGNLAFASIKVLNTPTFPDTLTTLGEQSFYQIDWTGPIILPDSLTSIPKLAFYRNINITSVTTGNGATSIGEKAFMDCELMTTVTIGKKVTSIVGDAFGTYTPYFTTSLNSIIIDRPYGSIPGAPWGAPVSPTWIG